MEAIMKLVYPLLAMIMLPGLPGSPAVAVEMQDIPHTKAMGGANDSKEVHKGNGTINKIDSTAGKINLTHGPIKSLGWAGMTMDFLVADKSVLTKLSPGQRVTFDIEKREGRYLITHIAPTK